MAETKNNVSLIQQLLEKMAKGFKVMDKKETIEEDDAGKRKIKTERHTKTVLPNLDAVKLLMSSDGGDEGGLTIVSEVPRPSETRDVDEEGGELSAWS